MEHRQKIKIFRSSNHQNLEKEVNLFLAENLNVLLVKSELSCVSPYEAAEIIILVLFYIES